MVGSLQLLLFALLAFAVLMLSGIHPPEIRAVNLDTDWSYRRLAPWLIGRAGALIAAIWAAAAGFAGRRLDGAIRRLYRSHGPEGRMARSWPTGAMVIWIAVLLGATLILNFTG